MRAEIDAGLTKSALLTPKSGYVDLHAEAVGKLMDASSTVGRLGAEVGYQFNPRFGLYAEANALTDRSWNAGAGLRWRF